MSAVQPASRFLARRGRDEGVVDRLADERWIAHHAHRLRWHRRSKPADAPAALFTDFTFDTLGVPRNADIPANVDAAYFDQGLCGPTRTDLDEFYPPDGVGGTLAFDDLPDERRANVNTTEGPYNRQPGAAPALNEEESSDLVAFLRTLTDGYRP